MNKKFYIALKARYFFCLPFVIILLFGIASFAQSSAKKVSLPSDEEPFPNKKIDKFSPDAFVIGRDLHHNTFQNQEKGLQGMADCYFTLGDAADAQHQNMGLCEKLGLRTIISQHPHLEGKDWEKMSDAEIDTYIKNMVKNGGKSKAIVGYHICDEPSATAFPALAKAVAAVRKYAPGKLAAINLYPNYATIWQMNQVRSQLGTKTYTEYLERFVNEVKPMYLCYDNYMVQMSMDLKIEDKAALYYTNLLEVRRISTKYNLPFWNVVSSNQIRPFTPIPSPANLAFQAYTSLAAGASGVRWFTYHGRSYDYNPMDKDQNRTLTWRYLQEVNRQLSVLGPIIKQMTSTGVYFTSPAPESSLSLLPGKWVEKVESEAPMMVGEFVSANGTKYVMVVNLSLEKSAKFDLETKIPQEELWIVSAAESGHLTRPNRKNGIWLTAGQGVLIKCGGKTYIEPEQKKPVY